VDLKPLLSREARLMALLHMRRSCCRDLISPFKAAVGIDYKDFELRFLRQFTSFRAARKLRRPIGAVKKADLLAPTTRPPTRGLRADGGPALFRDSAQGLQDAGLVPLATAEAQALFLERFRRLSN